MTGIPKSHIVRQAITTTVPRLSIIIIKHSNRRAYIIIV